jgi:hypothetical protein
VSSACRAAKTATDSRRAAMMFSSPRRCLPRSSASASGSCASTQGAPAPAPVPAPGPVLESRRRRDWNSAAAASTASLRVCSARQRCVTRRAWVKSCCQYVADSISFSRAAGSQPTQRGGVILRVALYYLPLGVGCVGGGGVDLKFEFFNSQIFSTHTSLPTSNEKNRIANLPSRPLQGKIRSSPPPHSPAS